MTKHDALSFEIDGMTCAGCVDSIAQVVGVVGLQLGTTAPQGGAWRQQMRTLRIGL